MRRAGKGLRNTVKSVTLIGVLSIFLPMGIWITNAHTANIKSGIVFCDFQKAAKESKTGKRMLSELQRELEKKAKILQGKKERLDRLRSDLNKKSLVMDEEKKKAREDEYFDSMRDFQRYREDVERELKKKEAESTQKIMMKLRKVVREIGIDEGFDAILPMETSVYFSKELDITNLVIRRLDRAK